MIETLAHASLYPFLVAGAFVFALLILEVVLISLGLSSGPESDAAGLDAGEMEADLAGMDAADIAAEFDIAPSVAANIEAEMAAQGFDVESGPGVESLDAPADSFFGGLLGALGLRALPLTIWLALFSAGFAATGLAVQVPLFSLLGFMLPLWLMVPGALVVAGFATGVLAQVVARLIPRDETSAISERNLGRRMGVVTVGAAKRGSPAQVRIRDQFGTDHYLMLEPLSDTDTIPEGSEVLVLRLRGGLLRLVQTN